MERLPGSRDITEKPPKVHYLPLNPYEEMTLQYTTLEAMGYPLKIDVVHKSDPKIAEYQSGDDSYHQWEMDNNDHWAIVTVDPELQGFVELLDCPGDRRWTDDKGHQDLLESHPVKIIRDIDFGNVNMIVSMHQWHLEGICEHLILKHAREDYPWDEFYKKCIVAAADRYRMRLATNQPDMSLHRLEGIESGLALADELRKEVDPINGEQLAGLVEDYYRTVGNLKPEFLALKK